MVRFYVQLVAKAFTLSALDGVADSTIAGLCCKSAWLAAARADRFIAPAVAMAWLPGHARRRRSPIVTGWSELLVYRQHRYRLVLSGAANAARR
jgi:hypothetical protein